MRTVKWLGKNYAAWKKREICASLYAWLARSPRSWIPGIVRRPGTMKHSTVGDHQLFFRSDNTTVGRLLFLSTEHCTFNWHRAHRRDFGVANLAGREEVANSSVNVVEGRPIR